MPHPMPFDELPAPRPEPTGAYRRPGEDEHDADGHRLALRLPDWDLVPPTEFLDRTAGRRR